MSPAVTARYELLATTGRDVLGEGPWWDVEGQRLLWIDIKGRRVRRASLDGVEAPVITTPSDVGFAVLDDRGGLVAGLRDGLYRYSGHGWSLWWAGDYDSTCHRVNDGKTDRAGRIWFGTMHDPETEASSALYRSTPEGCSRLLGGITTSNGLGWSPDGRTFYYTDSIARLIWAFEVDPDSGDLRHRRVFAQDPAGYVPDGLTVDVDGTVWAAKWDGGKVVRYRPDGGVDTELAFPVARPTSVAFVGADLQTLAVTSACLGSRPDDELAGRVFLVPTTAQGLPEQRAATRPACT